MNLDKLLDKKWLVSVFFLVLVFALKFNTLKMPYVRDPLGNYVMPSIWVKDNNFNPFFGNDKLGSHPPLFFEVLALGFSIFGLHLWASHLIVLLSAIVTLYYTYLIGFYLYKSEVGFIAALLLLFYPLFFAQIGMVMLDVFLMMIATITVYYALRRKTTHYLIIGSLLVLTKEPGIIIITGITLYKTVSEKRRLKQGLVYASPGAVFLLWLFISKLAYGWIFFPDFVNLFGFELFLKEIFFRLDQIFVTNYKLILTLFILFCIIKATNVKLKSMSSLGLISFIVTYITCRYIANILFLIKRVLKTDLIELLQTDLYSLYSIRFILPILVLAMFLIPGIIKYKKVLYREFKKEAWLFLFCIFLTVLFFSFISGGYQQRYMLMVYPLFFIISSKAMTWVFKNRAVYIFAIAIILALFVTKWWGDVYPICGPCEENLEYFSVIETHQEMARFIESNYPNSIILTECPQTHELTLPWAGYVKKGLKVTEVEKDDILRLGINKYKIPPPDKFDLVYYSVGGIDSKELEEAVNLYNLTLIKKIEKNGKIAYLYGRNG